MKDLIKDELLEDFAVDFDWQEDFDLDLIEVAYYCLMKEIAMDIDCLKFEIVEVGKIYYSLSYDYFSYLDELN